MAEGGAGHTEMAAEAGNAPTDVAIGIQPDASAVHHTEPTGRRENGFSQLSRHISASAKLCNMAQR